METSSEIKEIADALGSFQVEVGAVAKDSTNPFFKSKYASLENVIHTIKEPMAKFGLSFSQLVDGEGLTTIIMHTSGEWIKATAKLIVKDQTPQGLGSAITYMRRYALSAALGLATEDDDDGNGPETRQDGRSAKKYEYPAQTSKNDASGLPEAPTLGQKKMAVMNLVDEIKGTARPPKSLQKEYYRKAVQELVDMSLEEGSLDEILAALHAKTQ